MATAATKRYLVRFTIAISSYVVLIALAIVLARLVGDSPWRFAVMALPVPSLIAVVWAVVRYLHEADEFLSKSSVESLAIGFAGGSVTTFSYGLMQFVGAPTFNWTFVWVVYAVWWLIGGVIVRRWYR